MYRWKTGKSTHHWVMRRTITYGSMGVAILVCISQWNYFFFIEQICFFIEPILFWGIHILKDWITSFFLLNKYLVYWTNIFFMEQIVFGGIHILKDWITINNRMQHIYIYIRILQRFTCHKRLWQCVYWGCLRNSTCTMLQQWRHTSS